ANSIAAIEAALEAGVDLVELDVLGGPRRALVLGHSRRELGAEPATLDDAFELLAGHNPTTGLIADIKVVGRERELVEGLRRRGRARPCPRRRSLRVDGARSGPRRAARPARRGRGNHGRSTYLQIRIRGYTPGVRRSVLVALALLACAAAGGLAATFVSGVSA